MAERKIHAIMFCNVIYVPALGEQNVNFTKIGIINNLRYSSSCYPDCFRDLLLEPSKDSGVKY